MMYDLTVEEVHTFAVGDGDWVVHNTNPLTCWRFMDANNPDDFLPTVFKSEPTEGILDPDAIETMKFLLEQIDDRTLNYGGTGSRFTSDWDATRIAYLQTMGQHYGIRNDIDELVYRHATGHHSVGMPSLFVSLTDDIDGAIRSEEPGLQGIIFTGSSRTGRPPTPHVATFTFPSDIYNQRIFNGSLNDVYKEGELLFMGPNLRKFYVGHIDNPFPAFYREFGFPKPK